MASLISVRLNKGDAPSLGFRLQGGLDFGTPLVVQKVNAGSPAERAGLTPGDSVIKINNTDVFNLRHKDAQDVIVRAGPAFEVTIQRGGSTWKPSVIPTGSMPAPAQSVHHISPVTKTSLASTRNDNFGAIGTGHNLAAKPFSPQLNGSVNGNPRLVNNQYNSPLRLYSDKSIAETLSAQTEVLSTGALGVNFKKNEKDYDATNSAVYQMLLEAENDPKSTDAESDSGVVTTSGAGLSGLRHVSAPETRPAPANPQLPPGQNICADCERLIVGVFVRIKDKNLHVECFKCATCGSSLKNVGYYNINNKLYCDVHAKLAARNNPPASNLVPVTVPPGGKVPVGAISAALSSHSYPSPSSLSPRPNVAPPFQHLPPLENQPLPIQNINITNELIHNNINTDLVNSTPLSFEKYLNKGGNYTSAPKPFSSVSAPTSSMPNYNSYPVSPISSGPPPSFNSASSVEHVNENPPKLVRSEITLQIGPHKGTNSSSPELNSEGSSPRSNHSFYSSSSNKLIPSARNCVMNELKCSKNHLASPLGIYAKISKPQNNTQLTRFTEELPVNLTFANNDNNINDDAKTMAVCSECNKTITRGPFITALGKIWCPDHFVCSTPSCRRPLQDLGFVEEHGHLYCEYCFEQYLAPPCSKCNSKIKGDCLKAIGRNFHPECFACMYCGKLFANSPFFLEEGNPYCEADWNELFTTKCFACGFPVEAGDRWVEALSNNYHSQCFNCTMCKKNLEGQSFFAKGGRPFCKNHAR